MPFRIHNCYEQLGRSEFAFPAVSLRILHKVANEGWRGVLRGSSSDDKVSRDYERIIDVAFRDLELSFSERRMLGIQCKKLSYLS